MSRRDARPGEIPAEGGGPGSDVRRTEVELELSGEPTSPALARRLLSTVLEVWDCDDDERVAHLLTTELVTNVVLHARGRLVLEISLQDDVLKVAATDRDPHPPIVRGPAPAASEGGRGMELLSRLSQRWGVRPHEDGKTVWFEVPVRPRGDEPRTDGAPSPPAHASLTRAELP